MKVLLIKDVKSLGKAGEIKDVKDGYGNNFLIAKGYAKLATDAVIRQYEAGKKREAKELEDEIANTQILANQLKNVIVTIKKKVGDNGMLFGSITKDDIAGALKDQKGIEIDKKTIEFAPIKTTGTHEITVKFRHGIGAIFGLEVAGE